AAPAELTLQLEEQARSQLRAMCERRQIPETSVRVITGGVVTEILRASKELGADLILIGHRPRSGLASLFSYTDESVVHKSRCDVLALNIH
ncbi:MAG: universal stress protein, partial [Stenotrophobium sp.]